MTYIITQPCIDVMSGDCVDECPVDCIYEGPRMFYINPNECIDCGACEPVCPVDAIFFEADVPAGLAGYIDENAKFFENPERPVLERVCFLELVLNRTDYEILPDGSEQPSVAMVAPCPRSVAEIAPLFLCFDRIVVVPKPHVAKLPKVFSAFVDEGLMGTIAISDFEHHVDSLEPAKMFEVAVRWLKKSGPPDNNIIYDDGLRQSASAWLAPTDSRNKARTLSGLENAALSLCEVAYMQILRLCARADGVLVDLCTGSRGFLQLLLSLGLIRPEFTYYVEPRPISPDLAGMSVRDILAIRQKYGGRFRRHVGRMRRLASSEWRQSTDYRDRLIEEEDEADDLRRILRKQLGVAKGAWSLGLGGWIEPASANDRSIPANSSDPGKSLMFLLLEAVGLPVESIQDLFAYVYRQPAYPLDLDSGRYSYVD